MTVLNDQATARLREKIQRLREYLREPDSRSLRGDVRNSIRDVITIAESALAEHTEPTTAADPRESDEGECDTPVPSFVNVTVEHWRGEQDYVLVPRETLEGLLKDLRKGEEQCVPYRADSMAMARDAARVSKHICGLGIETVLALLVKENEG